MKIGLFAMGTGKMAGGALLKSVAVDAERAGVATLWVPEHVVLLDQYASKYPYSSDGALPAQTHAPIFDPFISLATMAAATSKIRLGTGICLVPEHNPLVLGKVVATLDFLSGGRVVLGVGIGWLEEEFNAIGIPWERRAQRTRECIEAMRKLWGDEVSEYHGEFVNFSGVRSYPKPAQGAKVPIFFGGESGPALRRVAEYGTGWCGFNLTPDEAAAKIKRIEELLKANGRKRSDVELAVSPYTKKTPATTSSVIAMPASTSLSWSTYGRRARQKRPQRISSRSHATGSNPPRGSKRPSRETLLTAPQRKNTIRAGENG